MVPFVLTLLCIPPVDPPVRSYRELQLDVRDSIRAHALAESDQQKASAVRNMLRLHCEIVAHDQFASSRTLQGYRAQLWSRLKHAQSEIERRQKREARQRTATDAQRDARGGGAAAGDYGPDLVRLIERTIAPDFWDVNGGPGTIVYYRPLRVLVVRATGDVHHRIGGLLRAWH